MHIFRYLYVLNTKYMHSISERVAYRYVLVFTYKLV